MTQGFASDHWTSDEGTPLGGCTYGVGFAISWQNGALRSRGTIRKPNGAFVEDVIAAARDRLAHFQDGRFACDENAEAIEHLTCALEALKRRTAKREARGVDGTHTP